MGKIVARVDRDGIVRYTNNPSTAQFAGMFIERCVSPKGTVAYYFLDRKTRKNTGWSLSQREYDEAQRVGAFITVAERRRQPEQAQAEQAPTQSQAKQPEPKYYHKSHDYQTGKTVGQPRRQDQQQATASQQVAGRRAAQQIPDNTAGFSMSVVANSEFFHDETPAFDASVLQEQPQPQRRGILGRFLDGLKSFFLRPVLEPPTTKALPAPREEVPAAMATSGTAASGRHYRGQGADVPMIPRGRM